MSVFPLNIKTKEDHADKVVLLQGVDPKYYESAAEKNLIVKGVEENYSSLEKRLRTDVDNQELSDTEKLNAQKNIGLGIVWIQGAMVQTEGKTDLTVFEKNDLFTYHTAEGFFVGKIIADLVTIPEDLYDTEKIKLSVEQRY